MIELSFYFLTLFSVHFLEIIILFLKTESLYLFFVFCYTKFCLLQALGVSETFTYLLNKAQEMKGTIGQGNIKACFIFSYCQLKWDKLEGGPERP